MLTITVVSTVFQDNEQYSNSVVVSFCVSKKPQSFNMSVELFFNHEVYIHGEGSTLDEAQLCRMSHTCSFSQ